MDLIEFDEAEFKALIQQYNAAKKEGKSVFFFNGAYELDTGYAYYVIEYLKDKFPQVPVKLEQ